MSRPKPRGATNPILAALIAELPAPGAPWAYDARQRWLSATQAAFNLIYNVPDAEVRPPTIRHVHRVNEPEHDVDGNTRMVTGEPEMLTD